MKLFIIVLFTLAVCNTQAKFNLRTYAQQKLKAAGNATEANHHLSPGFEAKVRSQVSQCFDKYVGKDNSKLSNAKAVQEYNSELAMEGINLCLQSLNLRMGNDEDDSFVAKVTAAKAAAETLINAQGAFATDSPQVIANVSTDISDLSATVSTKKGSLESVFVSSNAEDDETKAEDLEAFLDKEIESLKSSYSELTSAFDLFDDSTEATKAIVDDHVKVIAEQQALFNTARDGMSDNRDAIANAIIKHYRYVDDNEATGNNPYPHPVSGREGEGCGTITIAADGVTVTETASDKMCKTLKCTERKDLTDLEPVNEGNLKYSGYYVCSSQVTEDADGTNVVDCTNAVSANMGVGVGKESASCNLKLIYG